MSMDGLETALLQFISRVYEGMGWPGVALLMAIENTGFPLPSEPIMMFAGWLLVQARDLSAWWVLLAGFYGALGSLLGAWLVYLVSLKGGRPLLRRYGKYVLVYDDDVARAEAWFQKYGGWAVFLGRLVPLVRTLVSVPAGIAGMNFWRFSAYTFAGSFLWNVSLAYAGFLLGENWEHLRDYTRPFDLPIVVILAILVAWAIWRRLKSVRSGDRVTGEASGVCEERD